MLSAPTKADLKPKRHHGYSVILFLCGTLFPPLAVAARFGIGSDFWLNLLLTICGYIPGHVHNFYIQNIRNNKNHARTPKWAQRYGLVDTTKIERNKKKSQWAGRYNDRLPHSTLEDQPYEEGQERGSSTELSSEGPPARRPNGDLWNEEDESYYVGRNGDAASAHSGGSGGRWHYPANFDDAAVAGGGPKKQKKKKDKKDRWARTEDAYSISEEVAGKKKKRKKSKSGAKDADTYSRNSQEFPEDAEGGLYSAGAERGSREQSEVQGNGQAAIQNEDDMFTHQF
ncbi:hypothetical protein PILCRDRAFT_815546 [Piloderma croceum F 1598]|uniref:Stress response RCI peptide n=1 Tax=Piloderma croceum (strain F 1598) TaxID=765440 RepID=A0A0C3FSE0_PILCF|nr:hypothetical protein PILCRDRAFT_815546 [Piloderma croceum F 1598]